jgi:hypothetical protein
MNRGTKIDTMISEVAWMSNLMDESAYQGKVGLWWCDKDQLYVYQHDVEDGRNYGGNMHTVTNHNKSYQTTVLLHRPDLEKFSYTYLPRGRIYFNSTDQQFYMVGTPELIDKPKFVDKVLKYFGIKSINISHSADEHYVGTMGPDIQTLLDTLKLY